ncbi:hypothetical protein HK102_011182 [Quaeritorhiza haematococci]|nr:hypothetical protein HK102_011182 [Quaeritorhiza haematococci]
MTISQGKTGEVVATKLNTIVEQLGARILFFENHAILKKQLEHVCRPRRDGTAHRPIVAVVHVGTSFVPKYPDYVLVTNQVDELDVTTGGGPRKQPIIARAALPHELCDDVNMVKLAVGKSIVQVDLTPHKSVVKSEEGAMETGGRGEGGKIRAVGEVNDDV